MGPDQLRRRLVDELLATRAITKREVEAAFMRVPREAFVPHVSLEAAYRDQAIPCKFDENGSAISSSSQPAIMALMLEQLDVRPGMRVLEVGAGSGYNAALLCELAGAQGHVTSIDIDAELVADAGRKLRAAGYAGIELRCADALGVVSCGERYDRILLTASSNEIAGAWINALPDGGRIVLPLIFGLMQASVAFSKRTDHLESESIVPADFMMLRTLTATSKLTVLGGVPSVRLRTKGVAVNADAVLANVTGETRKYPIAGPRPDMWALALWIDVHDLQFCRMAAHDEAARRGLVPRYGEVRSADPFVATEGLCDGENFVLLRGGNDDTIELVGYGHGAALAQRLQSHIVAWRAHGSPTQQQLQVSAFPDQRDACDAAVVLRSADSTTIVRYRRSPP